MSKSVWAKIDAYFFRLFGCLLGYAGCVSLVMNNSIAELSTNIYGVVFFVSFLALALYSSWSLAVDILKPGAGETQEKPAGKK